MKLAILFLAATACVATAQQNATLEEQFNVKAETQLAATFKDIREARDEVVKTIEKISDQKKKELYKTLFEKNEKAWAGLIDATALLQQPIYDSSPKPDIRYTRILDADYAEFRIKQYHDFVIWMKQKG